MLFHWSCMFLFQIIFLELPEKLKGAILLNLLSSLFWGWNNFDSKNKTKFMLTVWSCPLWFASFNMRKVTKRYYVMPYVNRNYKIDKNMIMSFMPLEKMNKSIVILDSILLSLVQCLYQSINFSFTFQF